MTGHDGCDGTHLGLAVRGVLDCGDQQLQALLTLAQSDCSQAADEPRLAAVGVQLDALLRVTESVVIPALSECGYAAVGHLLGSRLRRPGNSNEDVTAVLVEFVQRGDNGREVDGVMLLVIHYRVEADLNNSVDQPLDHDALDHIAPHFIVTPRQEADWVPCLSSTSQRNARCKHETERSDLILGGASSCLGLEGGPAPDATLAAVPLAILA